MLKVFGESRGAFCKKPLWSLSPLLHKLQFETIIPNFTKPLYKKKKLWYNKVLIFEIQGRI